MDKENLDYYNTSMALTEIRIIWYEGYHIKRYDTREDIRIYNDNNNAWLELQEFMKDVFDQREAEYKDAEYKPYTKVKLWIKWGDVDHSVRVDVGDSPDFNPYKEWIGDYIYDARPKQFGGLDMGQNLIFSERYEKPIPPYIQKQLDILNIAATLNPIPIMKLSEQLKEMAIEMDKELYDGTQFKE